MVQTTYTLAEAAAPIDDETIYAFKRTEAFKYRPNFWWLMGDWANRHAWVVVACFVAVMALQFFLSGSPFSFDAIATAALAAVVVILGPIWFAAGLEKGPAHWYKLKPETVRWLEDDRMTQLRKQFPDASYEIEVLQRGPEKKYPVLATIVWLVVPRSDALDLRRGVFVWIRCR